MPFPAIPALLTWAAGVIAAAVIAKLVSREHRRVNADLKAARARNGERNEEPRRMLRRDPKTGIYRPQ